MNRATPPGLMARSKPGQNDAFSSVWPRSAAVRLCVANEHRNISVLMIPSAGMRT